MDLLWTIPRTVPLVSIQNDLTWTSSQPAIASFANAKQGAITGHKKGSVTVTVTYSVPGLHPVTAAIEVIVLNRPSNLNEGDRY
ncbi:Bacterial Ig-like domain (group 2) [compost metagenome]